MPFNYFDQIAGGVMNYSYLLFRDQDGRFYIGSRGDLRAGLHKDNSSAVGSTAYHRPRVIDYEGSLSTDDAIDRNGT